MIKLFTILFCLAFSFSLHAKNEKNINSNGGGTAYSEESPAEPDAKANAKKDVESIESSKESDAEPDSSYYSVNKFNFLFYFVYKMKYMDDENDQSELED